MEQIYFEAQLCSEIAILKEKSKKAKKQKITFGGWSQVGIQAVTLPRGPPPRE